MRRAISCVYWAPKSRIRILSLWMSCMESADLVVRRLAGDLDVVHVALARAGAGDADHDRLAAHLVDGRAADVAHGRAQPTGELVDDGAQRAAVRDPPLDA